jgi:tetratricopeptide (TPR) repeat protein
MDTADAYCRLAEPLLLELVQQRPANAEYRIELSQCYRTAMRAQSFEGRLDQAEGSLSQAIDVLSQLARDCPNDPQLLYRLADALCLMVPQSDIPSAQERDRVVEATLMCQRLTSLCPNVPEYQTLAAGAWKKLADLQYDANELDAAEQNYTRAAKTLGALATQSPGVLSYSLMSIRSWMGLSDVRRDRGRLELAREAIDEAVTLYERDTKSRPDNPVYGLLLRPLYRRQAIILTALGRPYLANQARMKIRAATNSAQPSNDGIEDANGAVTLPENDSSAR